MLKEVLIVALGAVSVPAVAQTPGISGFEAPSWGVKEWINLPVGRDSIDVADYRGKVLYLYGFQSWCPGCHARGFPTLKTLIKAYEDTDDVGFVAVQTVFEGYGTNTARRAWATARRYELDIPVGHDGSNGRRSVLMRRYRTGGTPWTIVIDKRGVVRWNGFHLDPPQARRLIDRLRAEPVERPTRIETLPIRRGGQDLVGKPFEKPSFDKWIRRDDRAGDARKKPRAVLYRWWTNTCPYCAASLPAVERLRREYGPKGLRVVAVYHPKPPREVDDEYVLAEAERLGYQGIIAVDEDWSALRKAYLSSGQHRATSVTFLVDGDGVVRFLHPGPEFFPSDAPDSAQQNADYRLLEQAVRALLRVEEDPSKP